MGFKSRKKPESKPSLLLKYPDMNATTTVDVRNYFPVGLEEDDSSDDDFLGEMETYSCDDTNCDACYDIQTQPTEDIKSTFWYVVHNIVSYPLAVMLPFAWTEKMFRWTVKRAYHA